MRSEENNRLLTEVGPGTQKGSQGPDPAKNHDVRLPSACRDEFLEGLPRAEQMVHPLLSSYLRYSFFKKGQPAEVKAAYEQAVGQELEETTLFKVHGERKA